MKQFALFLLSAILFINQQACKNRQQTNGKATDSTTASSKPATDVAIAGHLAELNLTPNSDWRGINLGDDFANVKATEKGEAFESDDKHVGYTVEFKNLESADMLYHQANQKVSEIDVDLFLNTRQSVDAHQKELGDYFTSKYGSSKPTDGGLAWTGPKGQQVLLKDVSKGKDFGLKIKITSTGGAVTASAK
jgi:hypothetical protein